MYVAETPLLCTDGDICVPCMYQTISTIEVSIVVQRLSSLSSSHVRQNSDGELDGIANSFESFIRDRSEDGSMYCVSVFWLMLINPNMMTSKINLQTTMYQNTLTRNRNPSLSAVLLHVHVLARPGTTYQYQVQLLRCQTPLRRRQP